MIWIGGSAVSTGGGVAFVGDGNTVITGKVGGDVLELANDVELAQRPTPPGGQITRELENVHEILESSAGAATAAASLGGLVARAIQIAQSLFGGA